MFANRRTSHYYLLLILAGIGLHAQRLNDLTVYPALSAPTLPAAGGTFQDPTFWNYYSPRHRFERWPVEHAVVFLHLAGIQRGVLPTSEATGSI
jgi:hypothetical protein